MKLRAQVNIKQFVVLIVVLMLIVFYTVSFDYYSTQREQTAKAILKSLKDDMFEVSYVLSKNIKSAATLKSERATLDRAAANNDFVQSIMIFDNSQLLMTTDPNYRTVPNQNLSVFDAGTGSSYKYLNDSKSFEGKIRLYQNGNLKLLRLIFLLDKSEVSRYLTYNKNKFLFYHGMIGGLLALILFIILFVFISRPLEKLKAYLTDGKNVDRPLRLVELDLIRAKMIEAFERLAAEQKQLFWLSRKDSLTGLPNRNALNEHLEKMIKESDKNQEAFAFLFLDLDLFKTVNDSLGHHIGDELLKKVGKLLESNVEEEDFVARVGGDEFILLLHNFDHSSHVIETIERIQNQLSRPFQIQEHIINISSSVGVAFYPHDGTDFIGLMQCSDIAMYEAKKKGRAQYYFYTDELKQQVQKTITLEKAMHEALKSGHFELYYQPKVDMSSNQILGAEALIRWIKPDGTLISPIEFIPLAEENGFIVELGQWVLEQGIKQLYDWQQRGLDINLSINIATKQLIADSFEESFKRLLQTYPIEPSRLDIEITEYLFFEQSQQNYQILKNIQALGVTVSLDDFGTGYSSLSYLKKFPINCLKIDKSFVDDYDSKQGAVFLETIVKMAKSLNMTVVAEGVETVNQLDYLKQVGCDVFQGYYCSRPLPEEDFYHFLDVHNKETGMSQKA